MGGQGRKTIITYNSPKRYRKRCGEPDFPTEERLCLSTTSPSSLTRCHCPGCGSQRLLRCRSHPAGRCPNSSSLFPPLAAVVAVAPCRRGLGSPRKVNGFARGSPTRGAVERSETERLYKDGPALGSSLVNLPPRLSPQNAKPPRSCNLPGGFFLRESPPNLREWQLH